MSPMPKYRESDFPEPGSVFVATMKDGRLAAGRVLRREFEGGGMAVLLAGSPWIGTAPPPLDLPILREILTRTHHGYSKPSILDSRSLIWSFHLMPEGFRIIGKIELTSADLSLQCNTYGGWQSIPIGVYTQWRWDHDRDNLLREEAEEEAREAERRRIARERREAFVRSLTLEKLAATDWFASWNAERETTRLARERILRLIEELRQAPKHTQVIVKKLVRVAVKDFNALDKKQQFIDTIEREELCEAFEQIVCAARQPGIASEIDNWRSW